MNEKEIKKMNFFLSSETPNRELASLYHSYRAQFIAFIRKKYGIEDEIVVDIFQESFMELYRKIKEEELTVDNLQVSLKTYLFTIGKYHLFNQYRIRQRYGEMPSEVDSGMDIEKELENQKIHAIVREEVFNLGEPCNKVLTFFYFKKMTLREIALKMGYKNEQVAKNKRLACMNRLKAVIKQKFNKEDLI